MKNIYNYKIIHNNVYYSFFIFMFKYRFLFNSITQPHIRYILYTSSIYNSAKHNSKIISEF